MTRALLLALTATLTLAGCASQPKLVMINPRTGALVGCQSPNPGADSGGYLISRACLSACQAHGFRPVPGLQSSDGGPDLPSACTN